MQVMSRRLVEDFGYPISHLRTRPQWRVATSPSESKKYPVDITVFSSDKHTAENVALVVECKRRNRKDGTEQLKRYLDMSNADIGIWFNGEDHWYVRKVFTKDGARKFETLPNIPRYGQRVEDIGLYRKKDLVKPSNLRVGVPRYTQPPGRQCSRHHARRAARTRSNQSAVLQDLR